MTLEKMILVKNIIKINGPGITLTNNEVKCIIKVINSLENRRILLKRTNKNVTSQKGGFLNFHGPLIKILSPLMKNVLPSLAESVLVPLGVPTAESVVGAAIQK